MLHKKAFANALGALSGVAYLALYALKVAMPDLFTFVFNAQFLGADIASQLPDLSFGSFLGSLVAMVLLGWVMGYFWAWLYNRFSR